MSDRKKSSLGRGAASIFSGVPELSEVETTTSEEGGETTAENLRPESSAQQPKDEGIVREIEGPPAETQELEGEPATEEHHPSPAERAEAKDETPGIDTAAFEEAIQKGAKYPKVTVYSPLISSFMRYKEITIPRFKLSPEAESRLGKVLKRENPTLWKAVEEGVQWNKKKGSQGLREEAHAVDLALVEESVEEGMKQPKITIYSPIIAVFMRYLELTVPRFKLSPEAEGRLEKVLKREDPELWRAIEERIPWSKRNR